MQSQKSNSDPYKVLFQFCLIASSPQMLTISGILKEFAKKKKSLKTIATMKNTTKTFHLVIEIFVPQRRIYLKTVLPGEEGGVASASQHFF